MQTADDMGAAPTRGGQRLAFLALILAGVMWGFGFPLGKVALREIGATHMVLLRFVFASLAALPFALRDAGTRALFRSRIVIATGAVYAVAFVAQFEGLARINVSLAALLIGTMPALIAVGARIMGEPVSRLSWGGVIAASAGAALIAGKPGTGGSTLGILLSLLSLLLFLVWLIMLRRTPKAPSEMGAPAVTMLVATVVLVPIALVLHGAPPLRLSPVAWGAIVAQGVFCTLIATAAWQYGATRVGSAAAGVFINIEPLMGAAIGVLMFGDDLTVSLLVGGALIIAGSVVVVLGERGTAAPDLIEVAPTPT